MTFFTIGVSSSQTVRGKLHNGFWLWKILLLFGLYILAYSFPALEGLVAVWMIIGIVGALIFIYIQHISLIDFAYEVNGNWHDKSKKNCAYAFCIYCVTLLLYLATFGAYSMFVIFYGLPHDCTLNLAITGLNAGLTALFGICSAFSNTLRRRQLWLPGAVTSAFVAYLTYSALSSQPKYLSSNVPWQRRTIQNVAERKNISIHPLTIVVDQLNQLLSDQFALETTQSPSGTGSGGKSSKPTIMVNQCVPGGISTLSEHVRKDVVTLFGLTLVIGWSIYSSIRATMQARRMGIRTRRERLKQLLSPIEENPEPGDHTLLKPAKSPPSPSQQTNTDESVPTHYLSRKEVKRQEKALNMLASAVADLPNPKVFRRPSARQPENQVMKTPYLKRTGNNHLEIPGEVNRAPSRRERDASVQNRNQSVKSTLRVSSSVPDLTMTMRQLAKEAQRRANICEFDWSPEVVNGLLPAAEKESRPEGPKGSIRQKRKWSVKKDKKTSPQSKQVLRQLHPAKRKALKRMDSRQVTRKRLSKSGWKDSSEELVKRLSLLSPDSLPENFGSHALPHGLHTPSSNSPFFKNGNAMYLLPTKRLSHPQIGPALSTSSLDLGEQADLISLSSPNDLQLQRARWVSELVVSKQGVRLLESEPNLAASFAFIGPMMTTAAPRDGYLIYNEVIASVYSYPWFHFIFALSTLYLMAQLTNWYNPQISGVETLSGSWATVWMKLTSCWLALILYAWTIACPRLCIGRRLGDTPLTPRTPQSSPGTAATV
ncbi:unnamed protein product [Calicophoron daubneyi]